MKCAAILTLGLLAAQAPAGEAAILKSQQGKDSYAIGADLARNLKRQGVQADVEVLLRGMRDVLTGGKVLMAEDEIRNTLRTYQIELRQRQFGGRTPSDLKGAENREKGAAFLAKNKTKPGVVTLPSGLQYKILVAGTGKKPSETDTIECRHRGACIEGEEFNNSERAGGPAVLKMTDVIPGWKEALQLMPVGSKWQLFVPPQLAYGERGVVDSRGRVKIGANETLIFEIELLAVK